MILTRKFRHSLFLFLSLLVLFSGPANAAVEPSVVNVYDLNNHYHFGSNSVIPIDTLYIDSSVYSVLVSHGADSVQKVFPSYNPADTLFVRPSGKTVRLIDLSRHYLVYFNTAIDQTQFEADYQAVDSISSLNAIPIPSVDSLPTDLDSAKQIYLFGDAANSFRINATEAWDITTGSTTQEIAVLDIGFNDLHEEFTGRISDVWVTDGGSLSNTGGKADHGNASAGIAAANANNTTGVGMAGVNWDAKLFLCQASTVPKWSRAIDSSVVRGVDVLTISQSSYDDPGTFGEADRNVLSDACYNAWVQGLIMIGSKGNENTSARKVPADYPMVVGVGALDVQGNRLELTQTSGSNFGGDIWFAAPGDSMYRPTATGYAGGWRGTSAAAPLAAGAISLIQAANSNLWPDEVEQLTILTAKDIEDYGIGWDDKTGWGVPDVGKAVREAVWFDTYDRRSVTDILSMSTNPIANYTDLEFMDVGGALPLDGLPAGTYHSVVKVEFSYTDTLPSMNYTPKVLVRKRDSEGWDVGSYTELFVDSITKFPWLAATVDSVGRKFTVKTAGYLIPGGTSGNPVSSDGWWPCSTPPCSEPELDLQFTVALHSTPGDADNDTLVIINDVNYLIAMLFTQGPLPLILNDGDVDGNCKLNIGDVTHLISYIFDTTGTPPTLSDNDCVPGSLKLTPGDNFIVAEDVALKVGAKERNRRPIIFNASRKVHALALTLRALSGSQVKVTNKLDGVQLHWSQQGDVVRIGLLDVNGKRFITPADTNLIDIEGEFEIVSVEATDILADGTTEYLRPDFVAGKFTSGEDASIATVSLDGIHPNPFNPTTSISFSLPKSANVKIEIYNLLGQKVTTLTDRLYNAGTHKVQWKSTDSNGSRVASGVYFAKMISEDYTASKKMVILK